MIQLKTPAEIARMREAGRVVARTLDALAAAAVPGATPRDLDALAARHIKDAGAESCFLHYRPDFSTVPYPAVLCVSVNDVIVHGIPGGRPLRDGDLVSLDFAVSLDGYCADAAVTVAVGAVDEASRRLSEETRGALEDAVALCVPGNRLGDIGHAIASRADAAGYGMPEDWGGHGIGRAMHEDPHVPGRGRPGRGLPLREGLVLAIEPMFLAGGGSGIRLLPDGWTIATANGSRAAHWEHSVAVTGEGPVVLTVT